MKKSLYILVVVLGVAFIAKLALQPGTTSKTQASIPQTSAGTNVVGLKNGTYTGTAVQNEYGTVQMAAVISGNKITDVTFLQLPSDRQHSRELSDSAKPILLQETIAAQSANVQVVSGATQTSESYIKSLSSALAQAN